jgi:hypothetical protein
LKRDGLNFLEKIVKILKNGKFFASILTYYSLINNWFLIQQKNQAMNHGTS